MRHRPRGDACTWSTARRARSLVVLGYPDVYSRGRPRPRDPASTGRSAWRGSTTCLVHDMKKKGIHPSDLTLLPDGRRLAAGRVRRRDARRRPTSKRPTTAWSGSQARRRSPTMKLFDDPAERATALGGPRVRPRARPPASPASTTHWEGWEDAAVPPERLGAYLRDFRALLDQYGYGCSLYGHFGQGCVHTRIDFDLQTHERHRALPRVPRRGRRPGRPLRRLALGRARRRPVAGRAAAEDVRRRSWSRRSASSRRSGTPTNR